MIHIGLPAYNESEAILTLLSNIHKELISGYRIIVYDDGSTDNMVEAIAHWKPNNICADVILGDKNRGLGYAVSKLIEVFLMSSFDPDDVLVIMDADLTHSPKHIPRMFSYIRDGFDVVIASRYTQFSRVVGVKLRRKIISRIGNFILRLLFPIKGVRDYTCGYRMYSLNILKAARKVYGESLIKEQGFGSMAELLIKLRSLGAFVCETPIILRYDKKAGKSKMKVIPTIIRTLRLMIKMMFLKRRK